MALLFCDGFDTGDFANKWGGVSLTGTGVTPVASTTTPFSTGKAVSFPQYTGLGTARLNYTLPAPIATVHIGFAFNLITRPTGSSDPAILRLFGDAGVTEHLNLVVPPTGAMFWRRGTVSGSGSLGALSISPNLNQWYYLEFKLTISDTVGEITCRVDGNADLTLTSIDTKNAGTNISFDQIALNGSAIASALTPAFLVDDFYLCDTTGSRNNTFLGPVRIQTLSPNAAGADTGLTPVGGANYANVSDQSAATYNYSATVGARDTYALPDLVVGTTSVLAVRNVVTGQNSDAGAGGFKPVVRSGGTNYYDTTVTVGATNKVYSQAVRETDPATSAAWTVTNVNALQVGAEVS